MVAQLTYLDTCMLCWGVLSFRLPGGFLPSIPHHGRAVFRRITLTTARSELVSTGGANCSGPAQCLSRHGEN